MEDRRRAGFGRATHPTFRLVLRAAVVTMPLVALMLLPSTWRVSGAVESFGGTANADGMRFTMTSPGFPVTDAPIDGGGPTAQAAVDSLGSSRAYASYPYPGETAIVFPTLFSGLTGAPTLPGYPFYVVADSQLTPKASAGSGPYTLTAEAQERSATSQAAFVVAKDTLGHTVSSATVHVADDGTVTSEAITVGKTINVGPVYFGQLVSRAKVVKAPGKDPERTSSLEMSAASVSGQPIGLRDGKFVFLGNPAPGGFGEVNSALAPLGFELHYLPDVKTDSGVVAQGVEIVAAPGRQLPVPLAGTVSSLRIGRTAASAGASPSAPAELPDVPVVASPESPPFSDSTSAVEPAAPSTDAGAPGFTTGTGSSLGTGSFGQTSGAGSSVADPADFGGPASAADSGTALTPAEPVALSAARPVAVRGTDYYLVIVIAAAACLGGLSIIRIFAVGAR